MSSTRILEADQIERKLQRIARQILEDFYAVTDLHFITIAGNGEPVGIRLAGIIQQIGSTRVHASTVTMNKQNPLSEDIQLSSPLDALKDQQVVIVDDVLNSGKTLMYAVHHILSAGPSRVATAVLVDRIHRSFPIRADYCGLSLSTNLKEHIDVRIASEPHADDEAILFD